MGNVYEIVYYSMEDGYLCAEYSKLVTTNKDEDYIMTLIDEWNNSLLIKSIGGRFSYVIKENISQLNNDTFYEIMNDLKEL